MTVRILHIARMLAGLFHAWVYWTIVFSVFLLVCAVLTRVIYAMTDQIAEAPWLDLVMSIFTWIPWTVGYFEAGWIGVFASLCAQLVLIHCFCLVHRRIYGKKGRTITDANNKLIGVLPNQLALLAQLPAVFAFVSIRFAELTVYPVLASLARLPRYKQNEWVNLSRHKFSGLVGYDLLWCWYCDWMTGLWSLGSEMLRNIESFWCPIRFQSPVKCENASLDFPDVKDWVPADSDIEAAVRLIEEKYTGRKVNSWWGHPDRKTPEDPS